MSFEFIKANINLDFVGKRKFAYTFSGTLLLLSILSLIIRGPNYGVDFAGGSIIQIKFSQAAPIEKIKDGLRTINIDNVSVQSIGDAKDNEYLIRTDANINAQELDRELKKVLETSVGASADIRRVEMVGPQVGNDLKEKALLAILFSLLLTAVYISGRLSSSGTRARSSRSFWEGPFISCTPPAYPCRISSPPPLRSRWSLSGCSG